VAANPPEKPETTPSSPDTHRTTNFDIDRTVQAVEHPPWKLRAINIDVLINNPSRNPLPAERIRSINKLVDSAIGAGENHHVTVVDLPFADEGSGSVGEANPQWWRQRWMSTVTQNALLVIAGLLVLVGGVLPLLRHTRGTLSSSARPVAGLRAARSQVAANADMFGETEPAMSSLAGTRHAAVVNTDTVRALVANDPARTAHVIKEWIANDRTGVRRAS
jgi:flagellar biosynthesis/type III secretory pathway M-ring protein FliF/YscJ